MAFWLLTTPCLSFPLTTTAPHPWLCPVHTAGACLFPLEPKLFAAFKAFKDPRPCRFECPQPGRQDPRSEYGTSTPAVVARALHMTSNPHTAHYIEGNAVQNSFKNLSTHSYPFISVILSGENAEMAVKKGTEKSTGRAVEIFKRLMMIDDFQNVDLAWPTTSVKNTHVTITMQTTRHSPHIIVPHSPSHNLIGLLLACRSHPDPEDPHLSTRCSSCFFLHTSAFKTRGMPIPAKTQDLRPFPLGQGTQPAPPPRKASGQARAHFFCPCPAQLIIESRSRSLISLCQPL